MQQKIGSPDTIQASPTNNRVCARERLELGVGLMMQADETKGRRPRQQPWFRTAARKTAFASSLWRGSRGADLGQRLEPFIAERSSVKISLYQSHLLWSCETSRMVCFGFVGTALLYMSRPEANHSPLEGGCSPMGWKYRLTTGRLSI